MENTKKICHGECVEKNNESFAMSILKGYKKQFNMTFSALGAIILILLGYIGYDLYIDSQFETIEYVQDEQNYTDTNAAAPGKDVVNGVTDEAERKKERGTKGVRTRRKKRW